MERFREGSHEGAPGFGTAELGHVHHAGERVGGDQVAEGGAHARSKCHVGVPAAEHHHGIGRGRETVGAHAQAPPHPERIDDADARALLNQALDQALGGVGLARPRGAHDG